MVAVARPRKGSFVMSTNEHVHTKDEPNRPIRASEAARRAGVSDKTIRDWIRTGKLPGYRYGGGRVFVDLDDLEGMLTFRRIIPQGGAS